MKESKSGRFWVNFTLLIGAIVFVWLAKYFYKQADVHEIQKEKVGFYSPYVISTEENLVGDGTDLFVFSEGENFTAYDSNKGYVLTGTPGVQNPGEKYLKFEGVLSTVEGEQYHFSTYVNVFSTLDREIQVVSTKSSVGYIFLSTVSGWMAIFSVAFLVLRLTKQI